MATVGSGHNGSNRASGCSSSLVVIVEGGGEEEWTPSMRCGGRERVGVVIIEEGGIFGEVGTVGSVQKLYWSPMHLAY